jgi:hypothetical protein
LQGHSTQLFVAGIGVKKKRHLLLHLGCSWSELFHLVTLFNFNSFRFWSIFSPFFIAVIFSLVKSFTYGHVWPPMDHKSGRVWMPAQHHRNWVMLPLQCYPLSLPLYLSILSSRCGNAAGGDRMMPGLPSVDYFLLHVSKLSLNDLPIQNNQPQKYKAPGGLG